ncbi:hypothetical protein RMATCC62417_01659 [Rhizopus microsporus]|nr:hypothetical protein RMATCC62417_01659 [Rhizopus microsporus]
MTSAISIDHVSLLSEASEEEQIAVYYNYINTNNVKEWKVFKLFQALIKEYQISFSTDCIAIFKHSFKKFADSYESNDEKLRRAMQKLRNNCDTVLNSEAVKIIIRNEGIKHWRSLYTTRVIEDVYKDKNDMVEQTRILLSSTTLPLPTQSSIVSKRDSDEFNDNTNNRSNNKKLNHLKLGDIKGLSLNDKLEKLTKAYGEGSILDLVSPGLIPSRFAKEMKDIVRDLKIPLKLVCTREERVILIKTSEATSLKQIETVIKSITLVPRVGLKSYLFISLSKMLLLFQSGQLQDSNHKEGWFQGHVYADLFDAVFMFDLYYVTKRTECHATTIKYLRKTKKIDQNEKDVKIDLILFNNQLGDIFSCEDKPTNATEADVQSDIKKAKEFREKRLLYIQSLLPHPSNIKHIEVISSQFHGLKLTVYGSKMTEEGTIIHYQKTKALIPTAPAHMSQAAHFLLTVMSLQVSLVVAFIIDFDTYYLYLLLLIEGYCY